MENYPRGKFSNDDEGELRMSLGVQDKTIILDFGKPVKWLGLAKADALNLANALIEKSMSI